MREAHLRGGGSQQPTLLFKQRPFKGGEKEEGGPKYMEGGPKYMLSHNIYISAFELYIYIYYIRFEGIKYAHFSRFWGIRNIYPILLNFTALEISPF